MDAFPHGYRLGEILSNATIDLFLITVPTTIRCESRLPCRRLESCGDRFSSASTSDALPAQKIPGAGPFWGSGSMPSSPKAMLLNGPAGAVG
jgi:hypothetical protein